ncbi:hypothetical protein SLEP1_g30714 [Rubroshorea leprosula]|uniref:Uncharacterized protein n=1 Tax=Rubroshorea leprosula TaxID=152421 RepID=A0AAV5K7F8_9ROSI|nr:hypothetical protein SLEP1_g30714 [Rubroshorea leprosula]
MRKSRPQKGKFQIKGNQREMLEPHEKIEALVREVITAIAGYQRHRALMVVVTYTVECWRIERTGRKRKKESLAGY